MSLFKGLHFSFEGFTFKDKQELVKSVKELGGECSYTVSRKTTHLVINHDHQLLSYNSTKSLGSGIHTVTAQFIWDCSRRNKKLHEGAYSAKLQKPAAILYETQASPDESTGEDDLFALFIDSGNDGNEGADEVLNEGTLQTEQPGDNVGNSEEVTFIRLEKSNKPRHLESNRYFCAVSNKISPPLEWQTSTPSAMSYHFTQDIEYININEFATVSITSITAMSEFAGYCFEELRLSCYNKLRSTESSSKPEISIDQPFTGNSGLWIWGSAHRGRAQSVYLPKYIELVAETVVNVACGLFHTIAISSTGRVYSWGKGKQFQLGHGDGKNYPKPKLLDNFGGKFALTAACGDAHTAILTDHGHLWTFGFGIHGQLGHGGRTTEIAPRMVMTLNGIKLILVACGGNSSSAVDKYGRLYTWGSNSNGQLAFDVQSEASLVPNLVAGLCNEVVVQVSVGKTHMGVVTAEGDVWTWGCNEYAQLGLEGWDTWIPRKLCFFSEVKKARMIACGHSHTVALTREGQVYSWGRGEYGILSGYPASIAEKEPNIVKALVGHKVVQIASGAHHALALTARGRIWAWGCNLYGQGPFCDNNVVYEPQIVESVLHASWISCGGNQSSVLINGDEELALQYAKDGNYEALKDLLLLKPTVVEFADKRTGYRPLHFACLGSHTRVVELLLEYNADISSADNQLSTPLHICASITADGNAKCIKLLVAIHNIKLDACDATQRTPLHLAVLSLNYKAVEILVEKGCDKRAADHLGMTPLHLAVSRGCLPLARYLIRKAAPVTAHDSSGRTPLDYCHNISQGADLKSIAQKQDVFISYAHTDTPFARKVRLQLEHNCIKCWMDEQRLEAGSDWRADIGNGILNASIIIFLASPVSVVSEWCIKELNMGKNNGKLIWPAWYQKSDIPLTLSALFSTQQYVDLSDDRFDYNVTVLVSKLKKALAKMFSFEFYHELSSTTLYKDITQLQGKPYTFVDYNPTDALLSKTLKYQLSDSGIICVDAPVPVKVLAREGYVVDRFNTAPAVHIPTETLAAIEGCWVFLLVVSSLEPDPRVACVLDVVQTLNKPIVLVGNNVKFNGSHNSFLTRIYQESPVFYFSLQDVTSHNIHSVENLKRLMYVVDLLYKERLLVDKVATIQATLKPVATTKKGLVV